MAESGMSSKDRATVLRGLQKKLVDELKRAKGPGAAPLAHQLRMVMRELAELVPKGASRVDEIAARRAARKTRTAGS